MFRVGYMRILLVNLVRRHCFPVYWNGDNRCVVRGQKHLPTVRDCISCKGLLQEVSTL
ncbi:hypothetical protein N665_1122s0025 [Sinapis alba]|nr:hypothetical protein N665_1122s0025 [Sinapis alba]